MDSPKSILSVAAWRCLKWAFWGEGERAISMILETIGEHQPTHPGGWFSEESATMQPTKHITNVPQWNAKYPYLLLIQPTTTHQLQDKGRKMGSNPTPSQPCTVGPVVDWGTRNLWVWIWDGGGKIEERMMLPKFVQQLGHIRWYKYHIQNQWKNPHPMVVFL